MYKSDSSFCQSCTGEMCNLCGEQWGGIPSGYRNSITISHFQHYELPDTCIYTLVDDDANTWECSSCRHWWTLNSGKPEDNGMNYCPRCGLKITENKVETIQELIDLMK
jgi:hypothetical protein